MGRKFKNETQAKTFMVYRDDMMIIQDQKFLMKDIINLGLKAKMMGWNADNESKELEDMRTRIRNMSFALQSYIDKFNLLAEAFRKKMQFDLDVEVVKDVELKKLLEELE